MDQGEGIRGVNFSCAACGLTGSPLETEWRNFRKCVHSVHAECAADCEGVCPKCKSASPMRIVNREVLTAPDFEERFKKATKGLETAGELNQRMLDDQAGCLGAIKISLGWDAIEQREREKRRAKGALWRQEMAARGGGDADDTAESATGGVNAARPEVASMEALIEKANQPGAKFKAYRRGGSGAVDESDAGSSSAVRGEEERNDEEGEAENDAMERGGTRPKDGGKDKDEIEMEKALAAIKKNWKEEIDKRIEENPEGAAVEVLNHVLLDLVGVFQNYENLGRQSKALKARKR